MTYIPKIKFYDLSRFYNLENTEIDKEAVVAELSRKFEVPPEKIEIDAQNGMSIIYA